MAATSIQWTDHSINPIRARFNIQNYCSPDAVEPPEPHYAIGHHCEKISPGCANCYASKMQTRFGMPEFAATHKESPTGVQCYLDEGKLHEVSNRKKPTKYFWCDMTDMFGPWVPDDWLNQCFNVMELTPQHIHQVLTKRPVRMVGYFNRTARKPKANVWLGTSVENQTFADVRIPSLLKAPVPIRFLSCEPLLGPLDLRQWLCDDHTDMERHGYPFGLSWVIVGGESGHKARPMHIRWVRSIIHQCKAAGVACFVKQLGSNPTGELYAYGRIAREGETLFQDRKGGDMAEWPADLRVRQFPGTTT